MTKHVSVALLDVFTDLNSTSHYNYSQDLARVPRQSNLGQRGIFRQKKALDFSKKTVLLINKKTPKNIVVKQTNNQFFDRFNS